MRIKSAALHLLDRFLLSNLWFIFIFLDNRVFGALFLRKYLRNRPNHFFSYYRWKPASRISRNILILKTDAIGDYLLFRNFLKEISLVYRPLGYRIFLGGNKLWKELAIELDESWLDGSFWLDRKGLNSKPSESDQISFLEEINSRCYAKLLYPNFSREWEAGDWLLAHICSQEKWGFKGNTINESPKQREDGNKFFSHLIEPSGGLTFEFFRNKEISSRFKGKESTLIKPSIDGVLPEKPVSGPYAVLFPGASHLSKQWPAANFAEVAVHLAKHSHLRIIAAGSKQEVELCTEILNAVPEGINLAGKTSIPGLLKLIAGAELLISNDTAALHMGIQCGIRSIALWKGNHYGRFLPYPKFHFQNLSICCPPEFANSSEADLMAKYSENYGADISKISVSTVVKAISIQNL